MKSLVILALFVLSVSAIDVKYKDCGSVAKVDSIDVSPCETQPCNLKHGVNYTVAITFTPDSEEDSVSVKIYGVVGGVPVPFPFPDSDACKSGDVKCPLQSGVAAKYSATLPILSEYPAIKLFVKWELLDSTGKFLVCAEIPCAVVNGDNHVDFRRKSAKVLGSDYF